MNTPAKKWAWIAAAAFAATACGPASSVVTQSNAPSGASSAPAAMAHIGGTISIKGMQDGERDDVTLVRVVDNPDGVDSIAPDAGKRYYAVQFRIHDTGTAAYSDAPLNSGKVIDTQGQSFPAVPDETAAGTSFATPTNIAAGDTALGFLTFEIPAGDKISKVQFGLDSGMSDQTAQWMVTP